MTLEETQKHFLRLFYERPKKIDMIIECEKHKSQDQEYKEKMLKIYEDRGFRLEHIENEKIFKLAHSLYPKL